jgi:hypothetical protein
MSQAEAAYDRRYSSESAPHGSKPRRKAGTPRRIGCTKGGLNSKLHAVTDTEGGFIIVTLSGGQISDCGRKAAPNASVEYMCSVSTAVRKNHLATDILEP